MEKLPTNTPLDKLLNGGLENDVITNVYGPAGSGKSNICLSATVACQKKVIYVDTEGSFSFDRFRQLGGNEAKLKNIFLIDVHEWKEQNEAIAKLENNIADVGLIIVDSIVSLYRLEMDKQNFQAVNKQLSMQYAILSKITRQRKIPVLVTNQIYSLGEEIELTSRMISRYWSKALIELKKSTKPNCRIAYIRKHRSLSENRKLEFKITEKGIEEIGVLDLF